MFFKTVSKNVHILAKTEALEEFLGIQGILAKRDTGYFCNYLKGYRILGSILGIWGYNAF